MKKPLIKIIMTWNPPRMKLGGIGIKGKHNIPHKNKKNVPYPPQSMPGWNDYHG